MKRFFTFISALLLAHMATAQAPANDLCSGAIDLSDLLGNGIGVQQTSDTYTNIDATGEPDLADALQGFWFDQDSAGNAVSVDQSEW